MAVIYENNIHAVTGAMEEAKKMALEIIGGKAESYAKQLCPVDTGRLRNSITHAQMDENTEVVGTNVDYAPYVELGHHQQPGRFVPKIKKRLVHDFVPGKPFLRPAVENHLEEYKAVVDALLGGK